MSKALFSEFIAKDPETAWKEAGKPKIAPVEAERAKVVAYVDKALAAFEAKETAPARGAFKIKGDMAQVTIKAGRNIVPIAGNERNVVPAEKLVAFLETVKSAAENGQLDSELVGNSGSTKDGRTSTWTPERRAAHAKKLKESWKKRKKAEAAK